MGCSALLETLCRAWGTLERQPFFPICSRGPKDLTRPQGNGLILPQREPRSGSVVRATVNLIQSSYAGCPHGPAGYNPKGERKCRKEGASLIQCCAGEAACSQTRKACEPRMEESCIICSLAKLQWEGRAVCFPPRTGILRKSILPH